LVFRFDHKEARRRREVAKLRPEAVALAIARTKETVVAYERGHAVPSIPVLATLCDLYDCSAEDLLTDDAVELAAPKAERQAAS
jgi:transcriptional regulator with XRE-family HTH domain